MENWRTGHALNSLDVIYAHKGLASMLSTVAPKGVKLKRGYDARGWCCFEYVSPPRPTRQRPFRVECLH